MEIDKEMLKVASEYFGLVQSERLKVNIADGIKFLQESANKEVKFDAILFDVDNKDVSLGMSCPPKQFVEDSVLQMVAKCLSNDGLFILNLVIRNKALRQGVIDGLKNVFKFISTCSFQNDVNEIVVASMNSYGVKEWTSRIGKAGANLNDQASTQKLSSDDLVNVLSLLEALKVET